MVFFKRQHHTYVWRTSDGALAEHIYYYHHGYEYLSRLRSHRIFNTLKLATLTSTGLSLTGSRGRGCVCVCRLKETAGLAILL